MSNNYSVSEEKTRDDILRWSTKVAGETQRSNQSTVNQANERKADDMRQKILAGISYVAAPSRSSEPRQTTRASDSSQKIDSYTGRPAKYRGQPYP